MHQCNTIVHWVLVALVLQGWRVHCLGSGIDPGPHLHNRVHDRCDSAAEQLTPEMCFHLILTWNRNVQLADPAPLQAQRRRLIRVAYRLEAYTSCWVLRFALQLRLTSGESYIHSIRLSGHGLGGRLSGEVVPEPGEPSLTAPGFLGSRAALQVPPRGFRSPGRRRLCLGRRRNAGSAAQWTMQLQLSPVSNVHGKRAAVLHWFLYAHGEVSHDLLPQAHLIVSVETMHAPYSLLIGACTPRTALSVQPRRMVGSTGPVAAFKRTCDAPHSQHVGTDPAMP